MLEVILVFPILLIFFLVMVQSYLLVTVREELLAASRLGARVAAIGDPNNKEQVKEEVQRTVKRSLGSGRLGGAEVRITWADDLKPEETRGEADWVAVTVEVPARNVVPDVLAWAGFSLGNEKLVAQTVTRQE
jgi:hypothetical protein